MDVGARVDKRPHYVHLISTGGEQQRRLLPRRRAEAHLRGGLRFCVQIRAFGHQFFHQIERTGLRRHMQGRAFGSIDNIGFRAAIEQRRGRRETALGGRDCQSGSAI